MCVYYRYLDYDVVRMRNNDDIIEYHSALNRTYEPFVIQPELQQENKTIKLPKEAETIKRSRRSLYHKKEPYKRFYTNLRIRKFK